MKWFRRRGSTRAGSSARWALAVFLLVAIASALVAFRYVVSSRAGDRTLLATQAQTVSVTVEGLVRDAGDQATAVAALFGASSDVTEAEFTRFITDIGLTRGMFGVGFVRVIEAAELPQFEGLLRLNHPEAFVFEVAELEQIPVAERDIYYPIEFFYSVDDLPAWGFDAATHPEFAAAIERILADPVPTASGILAFPGRLGVDGWVMFEPAFDVFDEFVGVVATAMDLGDVLEFAAPTGMGLDVDLRIVDLGAGEAPPPPGNAWRGRSLSGQRLDRDHLHLRPIVAARRDAQA